MVEQRRQTKADSMEQSMESRVPYLIQEIWQDRCPVFGDVAGLGVPDNYWYSCKQLKSCEVWTLIMVKSNSEGEAERVCDGSSLNKFFLLIKDVSQPKI